VVQREHEIFCEPLEVPPDSPGGRLGFDFVPRRKHSERVAHHSPGLPGSQATLGYRSKWSANPERVEQPRAKKGNSIRVEENDFSARHAMRRDPCRSVRSASGGKEIRRLDVELRFPADPCQLAWQVNQIRRPSGESHGWRGNTTDRFAEQRRLANSVVIRGIATPSVGIILFSAQFHPRNLIHLPDVRQESVSAVRHASMRERSRTEKCPEQQDHAQSCRIRPAIAMFF